MSSNSSSAMMEDILDLEHDLCLPPGDELEELLRNDIFIQTAAGLICLGGEDAECPPPAAKTLLHESEYSEDETVNFTPSSTSAIPSSDTGVDSDDPTSSDCSEFVSPLNVALAQPSLRPPPNVKKKVETNFIDKLPLKKKKGGWPKGRKRKPDVLHLPPKAPATGYNLYLNEMRKQYKDSSMFFYEVTKVIGNKWSSLTLAEKRPYLERAEEDKKRYREELKVYRESGAYQLYLASKRNKRAQNNVLSESDMDATDDIDDEDNEELYCRTCDQYFHNLHNKREHLQGRQHTAAVVGDIRNQLDASAKATPKVSVDDVQDTPTATAEAEPKESSVNQCIASLISVVGKREKEFRQLNISGDETKAVHDALQQQVKSLKQRKTALMEKLKGLKAVECSIETKLFNLWKVPSMFVTTDLTSDLSQSSEYLTSE